MLPSKFEANPTLRLRVKRASFSLFTLASSCSNAYFRVYAIIDFLADRLVFLNTVINLELQKNWKSIHQRGGKFQMHEQHKVICVTIFGTTDWLARTTFFIIALLPFTLSEDAAIQI